MWAQCWQAYVQATASCQALVGRASNGEVAVPAACLTRVCLCNVQVGLERVVRQGFIIALFVGIFEPSARLNVTTNNRYVNLLR